MRNVIDAIATLVARNNFNLTDSTIASNRANSRGDALEIYVKNLFADTFDYIEMERLEKWSKIFSWLGNGSSPLISIACRDAEAWTEKDILYTVGVVNGNKLKHLCMIYGQDYCASDECYEKGKLKPLDPLGITRTKNFVYQIENPWRVFSYVYNRNPQAEFNFMCVINSEKWRTFNNSEELFKLQEKYPALKIDDVKIKNPDNPRQLRNAKLITYNLEHL